MSGWKSNMKYLKLIANIAKMWVCGVWPENVSVLKLFFFFFWKFQYFFQYNKYIQACSKVILCKAAMFLLLLNYEW